MSLITALDWWTVNPNLQIDFITTNNILHTTVVKQRSILLDFTVVDSLLPKELPALMLGNASSVATERRTSNKPSGQVCPCCTLLKSEKP